MGRYWQGNEVRMTTDPLRYHILIAKNALNISGVQQQQQPTRSSRNQSPGIYLLQKIREKLANMTRICILSSGHHGVRKTIVEEILKSFKY